MSRASLSTIGLYLKKLRGPVSPKAVLLVLALVMSFGLATVPLNSAEAVRPDADLESAADEADENPESFTTCNVQGIGWVLCPVIELIGELNDRAFGLLSRSFLEIEPALVTDQGTRDAWASFRDIANVLFVIAFVFIVYAQMVGGRNN